MPGAVARSVEFPVEYKTRDPRVLTSRSWMFKLP